MQSLSRGWSFLKEAWQMAFKDKDLIKPSIYAIIVVFFVSIVGIIPLIGAVFLFGDSGLFGRAVMVAIGAILIFAHYVVSYIFSGMTVYLIYGYLAEGDGRMDKAWAKVQREFWNIISLAAVSTLVSLVARQIRRGSTRRLGTSHKRSRTKRKQSQCKATPGPLLQPKTPSVPSPKHLSDPPSGHRDF